MKHEKSCGAVVYYFNETQQPEYLLIQHQNGGHWSFPKGHVEENESEVETAMREIYEETNIAVTIDTNFREVTTYSPATDIMKDVVYFVAKAENQQTSKQEAEVVETQWLFYNQAKEMLTYESDQKILKAAHEYVVNTIKRH